MFCSLRLLFIEYRISVHFFFFFFFFRAFCFVLLFFFPATFNDVVRIRCTNKEHGLKMSSRVWLHFPTFHLAFASYRSVYLSSLSLFEYLSCFRLLCTRKAKCFPRYIQDKSWYACFSFASPPPSLLPPCHAC